MADPIGTVRREEHGTDFSIWVKVAQAQCHAYNPLRTVVAPEWLCVSSTVPENCGDRTHWSLVELDEVPVIGAVPGTPAAQGAPRSGNHISGNVTGMVIQAGNITGPVNPRGM